MAKDFGANVLPIGDDFADVSSGPASGMFRWQEVLRALDALFQDVISVTGPDWSFAGDFGRGSQAVIMFVPGSSLMSRRWAVDMRGTRMKPVSVLGKRNQTASTIE